MTTRLAAFAFLAVSSLTTVAVADTTVTEAETLVVVTPNPPVIVPQGGAAPVVTAAPGATPVATPAAAPAAPQNEDWSNVSHINGTPVKVGERSQYLHKFKKTNLSINPFGLFFGVYDVSAAHALSNHVAANVALTMLHDDYTTAYQLSATLPLYFRRTYSGPFLEGGLLIRGVEHECYDYCYDDNNSETWAGPQMMFGWHWTFDSGLNVALAFGVMKRLNNDEHDYGDNTEPNGYFRIGYAF